VNGTEEPERCDLFLQESGTYWFNPSSLEADTEFMLLGLVAGLAIYNGALGEPH